MKNINILVACGSGIASSSVAAEEVKKICADAGIPVTVHKGTIQNIKSASKSMDLVMTTSNYRDELSVPVIRVFGLISGIGKDKIADEIVKTCKEIMENS